MRIAALVATALVLVGGAAGASAKPSLRFVSPQRPTLRGAGWVPRELVRIRLTSAAADATQRKTVRVTATGTFRVLFGATGFDPCTETLHATATGNRGDRAEAKLPQRECPPAP